MVQVTNPDLTFTKIYFLGTSGTDSGWKVGLPYLVESYDVGGSIPQRQAVTNWTQDDDTSSFVINPRVLETNVHDPAGNRKRTEIVYHQYVLDNGMTCQLPEDIREYDANATSVLRTTRTIYEENAAYLSRRIIGLPKQRSVYTGLAPSGTLQSKVEFIYDQTAIEGTTDPAAIQHDNSNFGVSFALGRGNLTSVRRYDMDAPTQFTTTTTNKYNRVGILIASKDADDHEVTISYADSFASNGTPTESNPQDATRPFTTLAYPTTVNDADGNSTKFRYNYDFGARTWQQTPQPNLTTYTPGPIQTFTFDVIGRLARTTSLTNNAFTRYNYGLNYIETFSSVNTVVETANEGHTLRVFDGHGRVIATASDHPNTTPSRPAPVGDFSAQLVLYDRMGRVQKRSNPTETSISIGGTPINPSQFSPLGDDAIANGGFGWKYVQQTYDWKGRPLVTTNQDGTTKAAAYTGCGCAGGEVVMLTDEGTIDAGVAKRRQQKIYSDVLSRVRKTEILNWDGPGPNGTGGSVYSATVNTYNARDQITQVREYVGAEGSGTYQDTTMTYDGYGRLKTKRVPEQNPGTATTWDYNADDTIQKVTDARGASQTFSYNKRHLPTGITYAAPGGSGITVPAVVSFGYDGAGNRVSMTDGSGGTTYGYDQLSRLTSEARTFTGLTGTFAIGYGYNLANQLTSLAEPTQFGSTFSYVYDAGGRLTNVNGSAFAGVTNYASNAQYRAWGTLKHLNYGNSKAVDVTYNSRLQAVTFDTPGVITKSYDYYADGALRFSSDSTNHKWDRFYSYDNVGRIKEAFSGAEARFEGQTTLRPYRQTFSYDGFNHITDQLSLNWSTNYSTSDTYSNNRNVSWNYDAQGNLLAGVNTIYSYDAAGRISTVLTSDPDSTTARSLDGDGQQVKTEHVSFGEQSSVTTTCYYLRSSVLQGQVLTEIGSTGVKKRTFVYAGKNVLAWQVFYGANPGVVWQHQDPSQASFRTSDMGGQTVGHSPEEDPAELDPAGANAGLTAPLIEPVPPAEGNGSLVPYPSHNDPARPDLQYAVDGIPVPVDYFRSQVDLAFQSSLGLAEAAARATARLQSYDVSTPEGRLNFGLNFDAAAREAYIQGHRTVRRNWLVNDSAFMPVSGLSPLQPAQNPQQTQTPEQRASARAAQLIAINSDCSNFMSELIALTAVIAVKPFNAPPTPDFSPRLGPSGLEPSFGPDVALNLYNTALTQRQVTASNRSGRSGDVTTYGTTTNHTTIAWNREFYGLGLDDQALMTLHESLHLLNNFTDWAIADAAHMLATRNERSPGTRGNFRNQDEQSMYINEQIAAHCRP